MGAGAAGLGLRAAGGLLFTLLTATALLEGTRPLFWTAAAGGPAFWLLLLTGEFCAAGGPLGLVLMDGGVLLEPGPAMAGSGLGLLALGAAAAATLWTMPGPALLLGAAAGFTLAAGAAF